MNELNPRPRPRQIAGVVGVTALFLALLMASAIAGSASTSGFTDEGFADEDPPRNGPFVTEPTDSLRKVQVPVIETEVATVDVCAGEGLVAGRAIDSAVSMQELIDTYCYPLARLAQVTVDDSYPSGRIAGRVDE